MPDVFSAFQKAGENVGTLSDVRANMGTMVVRTFMVAIPPQNPATVRISFESTGEKRTKVRFSADSVDGIIGLGSAGGAIDRIIADADSVLAGRPIQRRERNTGLKILVVFAVILGAGLLYLILAVQF